MIVSWVPLQSAAEEKEQTLFFWGDLRGRWEAFRFSEDETGSNQADRRRIRYRLRLNAKAKLNPHAAVELRIGTGDLDHRSGNQTIGSPIDFGPNELDVRRAYLVMMPYADGELPNGNGAWAFQFGRVPNPFLWKNGKDIMLWDNDINPGGLSTTFDLDVGGSGSTFANAAAFLIEEKKGDKDPYLAALQAGLEGGQKDGVNAGIRGTFYYFDNLDTLFIQRGVDGTAAVTSSGGNIADGLTGGGSDMQVIETQAFVKAKRWMVLAFGGYSNNLSAEPSKILQGVGKESTAFNLGIEGGDKKKYVKIGGAYYFVEANAFPSQFIDSDLLEGHTNRKGFLVYGSRQLFKSTDFNFAVYGSDAIETTPGFAESVKDSERTRVILDLVYKF
jgi:hypothetical protein